jgi:signal transduction histidine kinase
MEGLFVALGIAILTLIVILLWFVPHLLHQQERRTANEVAQLREMLVDLLNEQETLTVRQGNIRSSLSSLQEQLEQLEPQGRMGRRAELPGFEKGDEDEESESYGHFSEERLHTLEHTIDTLRTQVVDYAEISRHKHMVDNESWGNLLSLLSTMLERIQELSEHHAASFSPSPSETAPTPTDQHNQQHSQQQHIHRIALRMREPHEHHYHR